MKIAVVYDNEALEGFKAGWGFACYVESNVRILFDTGWDGNVLLHNLKKIGVERFDYIMLSHQHWDHIGGLNHVIDKTEYVVIPSSFSQNLKREISRKAKVVEVKNAVEIADRFYSTGNLNGEQSAILESKRGLIVITGCAHPGLDRIVEKAKEFGKVYAIIGGFHNFDKIEEISKYKLIPCHCTSKKQEILKLNQSEKCAAGRIIEF